MKFISTKLSKESEAAKSRYIMPFNYCLIIMGVYFALTYYLRYEAKVLAGWCLLAVVAGSLLPVIMKFIRSYVVLANFLISILFIVMLGLTLYTGGIKASSIWWIGLIPIIAALLLNSFYSVLWYCIVMLEIVILHLMKTRNLLPENVVPPEGMNQFLITSTMFGIFLVTTLCVIADILRERVSLQKEELQDKSFRLTQMASLGSLASGVSHEINNPLAVIKGSQLKIKRMISSDEPVNKKDLKNYMTKIERNVRRIQEITLSMRAISDKDVEKKIMPINMQEMLHSLTAMARERVGAKPIVVEDVYKTTEIYFNGIYNEIFQALYNVVENSIDELIDLNNGMGRIELSLDLQGKFIVICIKDNGRGIPENHRANIFDPFFRRKALIRGRDWG